MKKRVSLLLLVIIFSFGNAQETELLNHTWYLHSLAVSGQTTEAPRTPEMTVQVFFDNNDMLSEMCCAGQIALQLTFDNTQPVFEINDIDTIIDNCTDNNQNDFRDLYIDFFQDNIVGNFEYNIQENNGYIGTYHTLTITNPAGDTVVFYSIPHNLQVDYYIFGDEPPFQTQWYLTGVIIDGILQFLPYETALQTVITFSRDGSFHSRLCGEIVSKITFVNDDGGGSFGTGEFYILCEDLTFTPGNCEDSSLTEIEQHYYNFLQNLANGNTVVYQRGHADFADFCGSIEMIDFYDPATNSWFFLADCIEPLSTNSYSRDSIVFYPNPVDDILTIQATDCSTCSIKIYNPNGKLLYSENLNPNQHKINLKDLSSGIYFLAIENEFGIKQTRKFLKK